VMVCEAVTVLPHASVTVQVLVMEYSLVQVPGVVASLYVRVVGPQPSVAVGDENTGVSGHWIVAGPPTPLIEGSVLSSTVIVCEVLAVLPHASVAINVLVTVYSLAQVPGVVASVNVIVAGLHASDAVGVAKAGVAGHWIVAGPGSAPNTGGVVSSTFIVWVNAALTFPHRSLTVYVLITTIGQEPEGAPSTTSTVS